MKVIPLDRMTMDQRTKNQNNSNSDTNSGIESNSQHTDPSVSEYDDGIGTKRTTIENECEPPTQTSTDKKSSSRGKCDDRKAIMTYVVKYISYLATSMQRSMAKRVRFSDEILLRRQVTDDGRPEDDYSATIKRLARLAAYFCQLSLRITNGNEEARKTDDDSYHARMALACVLCALEGCSKHDIPQIYRQDMVNAVYWNDQIDCSKPDVYTYRVTLREIFHSRMNQYVGRKKTYMANSAKSKRRNDTK